MSMQCPGFAQNRGFKKKKKKKRDQKVGYNPP